MTINKQLSQLGLSRKESDVYLVLLKNGHATSSHIAKEAALPPSSVRDLLHALSQQGLVSRYKQKNRFVYSPVDPSYLRSRAEKQLHIAESLVPTLNDLYHSSGKMASIRYFDNRSGFEIFFNEVLSEAKDLLMTGTPAAHVFLPEYFPEFTKKRIARSIPARLLIPRSQLAQEIQQRDVQELRVTKLVNSDDDLPASIFLWNNKVAIFSIEENPTILLIEEKNMTQVFRMLYDNLWNRLK